MGGGGRYGVSTIGGGGENARRIHTVSLIQIQRWCDGVAVSPDEVSKRQKVKQLLR